MQILDVDDSKSLTYTEVWYLHPWIVDAHYIQLQVIDSTELEHLHFMIISHGLCSLNWHVCCSLYWAHSSIPLSSNSIHYPAIPGFQEIECTANHNLFPGWFWWLRRQRVTLLSAFLGLFQFSLFLLPMDTHQVLPVCLHLFCSAGINRLKKRKWGWWSSSKLFADRLVTVGMAVHSAEEGYLT